MKKIILILLLAVCCRPIHDESYEREKQTKIEPTITETLVSCSKWNKTSINDTYETIEFLMRLPGKVKMSMIHTAAGRTVIQKEMETYPYQAQVVYETNDPKVNCIVREQ